MTDFYHRYRRGYPPAVVDTLVNAFSLDHDDVVLDVGCGTGQLTLPLSKHVGVAIGLDPEADMLTRARAAANEDGARNVTWSLGSDEDLTTLHSLLAPRGFAGITIAQAAHWMDHDALFRSCVPTLRPGGGLAVVTNGKPLWQHDTAWSRALYDVLSTWLGTPPRATCGTDDDSQARYRESLGSAGFTVRTAHIEYSDELTLEHVIGSVYSAFGANSLPAPDRRPVFEEMVRTALEPHRPFNEPVRVGLVIGTR
ncbi:class I SAM-dependent methyltransferase [Prauserella alba]|uniref:class I SAM-dependent methyltransferase n=1 Tax=Prauserella alba TaxID=176898 RepID=UPI0020A2A4F5|nr:class I SAM-dependent methyltransferase [Prauserella alba]